MTDPEKTTIDLLIETLAEIDLLLSGRPDLAKRVDAFYQSAQQALERARRDEEERGRLIISAMSGWSSAQALAVAYGASRTELAAEEALRELPGVPR